MFLVEITELGRNNASVSAKVPKINFESLYEMVFPHLVSSNISFSIEYGIGRVYAGFRCVGKIKVTAIEEESAEGVVS